MMNRDYAKHKSTNRTQIKPTKHKKRHRALFLTLLLFLFALFAVGLNYLHKHRLERKNTPNKITEPQTKSTKKPSINIPNVNSPEFDFYTILQQKKTSTLPQYELEITTTDNYLNVDQLKAKLLILGFDVNVTELDKNGKPFYHLTLGPYDTKEIAKRDQQQLQSNNITSTLRKSK